jgi:pimeloyl-ACP methyl ester carboxylesterase
MNGYSRHEVATAAGPLSAHVQPGSDPVVVFQHGLCGDAAQPAETFPSGRGFRHAVLNCRGHGDSPLGNPADLSIATFADDITAMMDALTLRPVAVGGISMGAAIALRLAVRRPDLVPALILSRPAWVTEAAPANMAPNAEVGAMLPAGLTAFDASATARRLGLMAPDNLASLRGFFARTPMDATAALLTRISADGPGVTQAEVAALKIPVLILATEQDIIHPMAHARQLAALIPGAKLVEVTPKGQDRAAHIAQMQSAILHFLTNLHFPKGLTHAASQS